MPKQHKLFWHRYNIENKHLKKVLISLPHSVDVYICEISIKSPLCPQITEPNQKKNSRVSAFLL